jgi:prephenate dehydrogenase
MRVAVIGVGLIGGSIALAARERLGAHVTGWDLNPAVLSQARSRDVIDAASRSLENAVTEAEFVFVAAPVGPLPELVGAVLAHAPAACVVSDVGSTKRPVVAACSDSRFVGGHPLAGAETSGVEHARADLFDGATWYLAPSAATAAWSVSALRDLVTEIGATPVEIEAEAHDRLMATVSHLPHVFANVLVAQLAAASASAVPGPSFRDATRVAGSNVAVWSDIYLDNRQALGEAIDDAIARLVEVRAVLEAADDAALVRWSEQAAADRARLGP